MTGSQKTPKKTNPREQNLPEQLLKPADVAKATKVSVKTVMRWIQDGDLAAFKLGG